MKEKDNKVYYSMTEVEMDFFPESLKKKTEKRKNTEPEILKANAGIESTEDKNKTK